jgi:ATP-dependent DNA ligase
MPCREDGERLPQWAQKRAYVLRVALDNCCVTGALGPTPAGRHNRAPGNRYASKRVANLCEFDLLEVDGEDLRRTPIEVRKATLNGLLRRTHAGVAFNRHFEVAGESVYQHACVLGCEGIVSKRFGSPYCAGRIDHWLKIKNPAAPAVKSEAEEEWPR